jgi:hypothetical protein
MRVANGAKVTIKSTAPNAKPVLLTCDAINNVRVHTIQEEHTSNDRFNIGQRCRTVVTEDLDIPGQIHRATAFEWKIDELFSKLKPGQIVSLKGLPMSRGGLNLLDFDLIKDVPAEVVASAEPAAEQAAE